MTDCELNYTNGNWNDCNWLRILWQVGKGKEEDLSAKFLEQGGVMGIDQAILTSIANCGEFTLKSYCIPQYTHKIFLIFVYSRILQPFNFTIFNEFVIK